MGKTKLTKRQTKYLITKYMGNHGGLNPKNIEFEMADGYEWGTHQFGGITIKKKQ